jgi:hypothetical protein
MRPAHAAAGAARGRDRSGASPRPRRTPRCARPPPGGPGGDPAALLPPPPPPRPRAPCPKCRPGTPGCAGRPQRRQSSQCGAARGQPWTRRRWPRRWRRPTPWTARFRGVGGQTRKRSEQQLAFGHTEGGPARRRVVRPTWALGDPPRAPRLAVLHDAPGVVRRHVLPVCVVRESEGVSVHVCVRWQGCWYAAVNRVWSRPAPAAAEPAAAVADSRRRGPTCRRG